MRAVAWMVAGSVASWLGATAVVDRRTSIEILCGMGGPLVAVSGTWFLVEWTYRRNPQGLTPLMAAAFVAKMVFFAAYVAIMLRLLELRPAPFMVSFTAYFIALYLMEALYLRRLFSGRV